MAYLVRDIPEGARFFLCRTKQKFRLIRRERIQGRLRTIVQADGKIVESTLHHSCHVKPIIRA